MNKNQSAAYLHFTHLAEMKGLAAISAMSVNKHVMS